LELSLFVKVFIIVGFGVLSATEYLSFYSRIAGKRAGLLVSGYTQQNVILVFSRFAAILIMPGLAYLIDIKTPVPDYLATVLLALICAVLLSWMVKGNKEKILHHMGARLTRGNSVQSTSAQDKHPQVFPHTPAGHERVKLFVAAVVIYFCYSMAFFSAFYLALRFHDYRSLLGTTGAILNGFANLLSYLYIEPWLAKTIDLGSPALAEDYIEVLLKGRLMAMAGGGPLAVFGAYLIA
jgi:hypothetical protein